MFIVILNPASGAPQNHEDAKTRRSQLQQEIEALFGAAGLEAQVHDSSPHTVTALAREALANNPEAVVAAGGDGTVSAVAAALAGSTIPLGVLPLGTLNHFAKDAGLPTALADAVHTIASHYVKFVDIGCINDRTFVNNASIGLYPSVVERREQLRHQGYRKWTAAALATMDVLRSGDEVSIHVRADRTEIAARTPFLFVGNNEYSVEGFGLGARRQLDAGRLYAYYAPPVRTRDLPKLFVRALSHRAREQALRSLSSVELWVDAPYSSEIKVACDGEVLTFRTPLHCRSWSGALGVLSPPSHDVRTRPAPGRATSAIRGSVP